jgi:hypothetical protein
MPASGVPPYAGVPLRMGRSFSVNPSCTRRRTATSHSCAPHKHDPRVHTHTYQVRGAWRVSAHRVLAQLTFTRLSLPSPASRTTQHDAAWFQSGAGQQAPSLSWATATTLPINPVSVNNRFEGVVDVHYAFEAIVFFRALVLSSSTVSKVSSRARPRVQDAGQSRKWAVRDRAYVGTVRQRPKKTDRDTPAGRCFRAPLVARAAKRLARSRGGRGSLWKHTRESVQRTLYGFLRTLDAWGCMGATFRFEHGRHFCTAASHESRRLVA